MISNRKNLNISPGFIFGGLIFEWAYIRVGLTFGRLIFGGHFVSIQWNLSKAYTIGTTRKCPLYRSVHFIESLSKSDFHKN